MKKLVLITLAVSTLALNISAKEIVKDFHIGASSSDVLENSLNEYNIGYGVSVYGDSNIYFGTSFDFAYGIATLGNQDVNVLTYGGDLKLGYAFFDKKLAVYGLGSAIYQSIDEIEGGGLGYGAGIDYRITDSIALSLEYKTYDMKLEGLVDYTYEKINSNLKYTF